jgi:hypothetical protein
MKKAAFFVLVGFGAMSALMLSGLGCGGDDSSGADGTPEAGSPTDATVVPDGFVPPVEAGADADAAPPGNGDAAPPGDANAPPRDAGIDAADAAPPPPNGTLLANVVHSGAGVAGVTSDGFVAYGDQGSLWVVSTSTADAGAPVHIATGWTGVNVTGPVVFGWSAAADAGTSNVAALMVWSKATGVHAIGSATYQGFAAVSGDGTKIIYAAATANGAAGDITVANTDGTNPVVLVPQAVLGAAPACPPQAAFAGAGQTDALVGYCLPTDAATATATLDAFSGASWTKKNLATGLQPSSANLLAPASFNTPYPGANGPVSASIFALDSSSANVLTVTAAHEAVAISYPGGVVSNLEPGAALPAFFVGDGGAPTAVYATQAGAMHASSVPATTPATLVDAGALYAFSAPSPDGKWGVYGTTSRTIVNVSATDLNLFATSAPGVTKTVEATVDAVLTGVGPSPFFTSDSAHLVWDTGITALGGGWYSTTMSYDLASGTSTKVADKVWLHWATSGSKLVYCDGAASQVLPNGLSLVLADIKVVDLAVLPLAPKTVQLGAYANFFLTPDLKSLVYVYALGTPAQNGIYVVPAL